MSDDGLILIDDEAEVALDSPWSILVVDDDPDVHATTRYSLERFVFMHRPVALTSAYSGREALEIFRADKLKFDLALIDVVMETPTDGIDTAKAIREHLQCTQVPYIIMRSGQPAYARAEDLLSMPEINAYLNKAQLSLEVLRAAIVQGLSAAAQAREALARGPLEEGGDR